MSLTKQLILEGIPPLFMLIKFCGLEICASLPSQVIENPQTIGQHLRNRRIALGLKQIEVSKILGVTEDSITYWENEGSKPQIQFYPKIVGFLGYNPYQVEEITVGGKIRNYRVKNGLNFRRLSELTGFDPQTLALWE